MLKKRDVVWRTETMCAGGAVSVIPTIESYAILLLGVCSVGR